MKATPVWVPLFLLFFGFPRASSSLTMDYPGAEIPLGFEADSLVRLEVRTDKGAFVMELYPHRAPITVANFLRYVDEGFFSNGSFHRTVHAGNQPNDSIRIAVIQGDVALDRRGERFDPIPLERTRDTGLRHEDGAVSMARSGPDTATSSFFVCIGDQPSLDYGGLRNTDGQGFAAFGQVTDGMDVVRAINASPADGQSLSPPVRILEIRRAPSGS